MTQTTNLTRDTMPPTPAGMVRVANPGTYNRTLNADYTLLASGVAAVHRFPIASLRHITRGYVIAGSAMRWQEACWSVAWFDAREHTSHGRNFVEANEDAARAYFAELTDSAKVSAMRQHDAMMEDTVYAPARVQRAAEVAARVAAEKARKAAMRARRRATA